MRKKTLGLLIGTLLVSSMFVGCGANPSSQETSSGGDNKKVVIAGIYKAGDQVWFINEGKAAEKMAKSMGASEYQLIDAKMNPDTYLQAIDNVIAQKVDGVITCIPDQKLSQVTVDKLKDANIPVIAADDALQDESGNKIAPWVGINAYKIGQTNGEWLANYIKENKLENDNQAGVLVLTMDTVSSCVPRTNGELDKFKEVLPNYPDSKIFKADYDGQTDKGFSSAAAIFTAHPEIKKWMVMSANEEGAVGATRALEQAGLDNESCVIGIGAYLAKDEFKKSSSAMKAATYFSSNDVGGNSAKLMMEKILNGKEIPMETAVDATVVTKDNYKEVMGDDAN
ncbi:sugar ABC transporter substrate-binding protein [Clostridium polyendosporum]|uniref:Sugar ABC transporter substrate-binding protein n=1 Tax=Clostridium polyendosporum TaxID=69208 RepID=A0A919RYR9_9CLOT|nr:arabinose ABC transporter substrate-binding protein [Clostridium polyendosporum]GIM28821.1 sugar ABC transporter substrate-binding protein [Clostridium polyendosporum]